MGTMEKGCSTQAWRIKQKLQDRDYIKTAISIISEQLLFFFYDEWKEEEES
jgi:hypothetical protein